MAQFDGPSCNCHGIRNWVTTIPNVTNSTFTGFPVAEFSDSGYVGQHRA